MTTTGDNPGREALLRFLDTDDVDAGCEETMRLLHVYVDLVVAGEDPELTHPGIAAHLRTCQPCIEDFDGLLQAVLATIE
jgi:hypothetical protein